MRPAEAQNNEPEGAVPVAEEPVQDVAPAGPEGTVPAAEERAQDVAPAEPEGAVPVAEEPVEGAAPDTAVESPAESTTQDDIKLEIKSNLGENVWSCNELMSGQLATTNWRRLDVMRWR